MTTLHEGGGYPVTFVFDRDFQAMIALLVEKRTKRIISQFAYPEIEGYEPLAKSGHNYSGAVTQDESIRLGNEAVVWELKVKVNNEFIPVGESEEIRGKTTTVGKIKL